MNAYYGCRLTAARNWIKDVATSLSCIGGIRRELRKLYPELRVEEIQLNDLISNEVLKRDVVDSENAKDTAQKLKRIQTKLAKAITPKVEKTVVGVSSNTAD